jgi:hypothetical protein
MDPRDEKTRLLKRRQRMNADFDPMHTPEALPTADMRMAIALEYIAFQLGQINRKIDQRTTEACDKRTGSLVRLR